MRALVLLLLAGACHADVYMQYPPGSNNRLDEGGGNRNNNNRLMDTQNNAKGGYGYGGDAGNPAAPVSYMVGSKLSVAWTAQHSCGSENAECQMVIQYMCNDGATTPPGVAAAGGGVGEGPLRDGTNNNAPDPNNPQANRGLHEPTSFYTACEGRERNQRLYTADQTLNGNDATKTRQNPNGARSALECPEERDYYPYWAPTPWKDLMILTNNLRQCQFYQDESQNQKPRSYCTGGGNQQPITEAGCTGAGGTWNTMPAFGIPKPECVTAPVTRDNHLGNDRSGQETFANITIPAGAGETGTGIGRRLQAGITNDDATNCVVRLRYNITTADTRKCSIPAAQTQAECTAQGGIWSAFYLDSSDNLNNNANIVGGLPAGNPTVNLGDLLSDGGGEDSELELAVNTNQYGRTFQDRSHVFSIRSRPAAMAQTANIYNLNVKGKRGNIVQTYPATEYDFHPNDLVVGANDYVHIQWTGNDNTNNNGNNNGEGTNNEDRHNIVQLSNSGLDVPMDFNAQAQGNMFDVLWEWNPENQGSTFGGARGQKKLTTQAALSKQTNCAQNPNNDQQRTNCEKLNNAAATVDLGVMRFKPGAYSYMSSRNNNFSNRAQKAKLTTLSTPGALAQPPTNVRARAIASGNPEAASIVVEWEYPGEEVPYTDTEGNPARGFSQEAKEPIAYTVYYSCDGGDTWNPTQCVNTETTCQVDRLPAGTACAFRVHSGSTGGWSEPSELAVVLTDDSDDSRECREKLLAQVDGNYLSPGTTAGIVVGIILAVLLVLGLVWFFMCKKKKSPPPPPPGGMGGIPPPPAGGPKYGAGY